VFAVVAEGDLVAIADTRIDAAEGLQTPGVSSGLTAQTVEVVERRVRGGMRNAAYTEQGNLIPGQGIKAGDRRRPL
jgi:hypothetical protein